MQIIIIDQEENKEVLNIEAKSFILSALDKKRQETIGISGLQGTIMDLAKVVSGVLTMVNRLDKTYAGLEDLVKFMKKNEEVQEAGENHG